jgi:hypothetical protein
MAQLALFDRWDAVVAPDMPGRYHVAAVLFSSVHPDHRGRLVHHTLSSSLHACDDETCNAPVPEAAASALAC